MMVVTAFVFGMLAGSLITSMLDGRDASHSDWVIEEQERYIATLEGKLALREPDL